MKLLTRELLIEYGFMPDYFKSNNVLDVLTRDNVDVIIKEGRFFYSNTGFDYSLTDLDSLKKLFKELKNKELTRI